MQPWSYTQALWHRHLRVRGLKDFFLLCVCANPHFHAQALCHGRGDGFLSHERPAGGTLVGQLCLRCLLGCPLQMQGGIAALHKGRCSCPALRAGLC